MLQLVIYNLTLHLIAITSTGIILVIWCDHKLMLDNCAVRMIIQNCVRVRPKADSFHN